MYKLMKTLKISSMLPFLGLAILFYVKNNLVKLSILAILVLYILINIFIVKKKNSSERKSAIITLFIMIVGLAVMYYAAFYRFNSK